MYTHYHLLPISTKKNCVCVCAKNIRKQSLVNQSTNPFVAVAQKLEQLPDEIMDISKQQISELTDPLIEWGGAQDELMTLAKASSRNLYMELEPKDRVDKINTLVSILDFFLLIKY